MEGIPFKYIIVDEAHNWVRGRKQEQSNQLTFYHKHLLLRAEAVFFLTGTPFLGDMQWDLIETIKSLACSNQSWWAMLPTRNIPGELSKVFCYTDEYLQYMRQNWDSITVANKTEILIPIMLRKRAKLTIDGRPCMAVDYLSTLVEQVDGEIALKSITSEVTARTNLLEDYLRGLPSQPQSRYTTA